MREVESCFQRLEQRYALFTSGPARADRFLETVSPAPADVVRTTLFSVDSKAKNRPAHRKADTTVHFRASGALRDSLHIRSHPGAVLASLVDCRNGLYCP